MPCSTERIRCNPKRKDLRGWIIEDVWISKQTSRYRDWEPHLQAIEHENRDLSLRYCYYKKKGRQKTWVPMPSFAYEWTIDDFREEVKKYKHRLPKIGALLKRFVEK